MMSHWILSSSQESLLFLTIGDVKFYALNICYFLYVILYGKLHVDSGYSTTNRFKWKILFASLGIFFYALIHSVYLDIPNIDAALFNDLNYCYFAILYLLFPLSKEEIGFTKWPMILCTLFLNLEVILYSLGILSYGAINDSSVQSFGGVMRISTSIGAATGTAVILMMISAISVSVYKISKMLRWILLLIGTIGVFFTVSRGAIISWSVFVLVFIYVKYLRNVTLTKKIGSFISIAFLFGAFYFLGAFNPLIERNAEKGDVNVTSGRDVRVEAAMRMYHASHEIGVGLGQVFSDKSVSNIIKSNHKMAPHNTYVTVLAEQGFIGAFLFILLFLVILFYLDRKNIMSFLFLLILLVNFNTEAIVLHAEYMAPIMFIAMISVKRVKNFI
jgi:O-antigen ligase